ncbi:hypothetical protein L202_04283 [Cryptococcus amylolentus CBS 6039]|uniref:MHYT domain-containing protein n=1 Tax=Cryptococcus amylolentus CBS 6039 TaxID=1295533 RepID=A0A1E3HQW8_9TREE|nr:hypothetical protein L202_04283 [Cryptococcus amylolentus CBS 6039]ODN78712.1 hypothetical protein L202_04283 [Cryptococcus amylolentus CBS 6039]
MLMKMVWPPEGIWNDQDGLMQYYQTHAIPIHPQPGALVASVIVSILGSYATLLVLGRRTGSRGWRNHIFLFLAAVVFSSTAVWSMHFLSMTTIRLKASPSVTWYIQFNPGMTTMSLFVPMVATALSFWVVGSQLAFSVWRVIVSGITTGGTICLMHYSASFRLPNLSVSYTAVTVVFAFVLAVLAATVALFLFFRLREQWQDSWWKRGLCAIVLAAAVCGMHYLGLGGTSYSTTTKTDADQLVRNSSQSIKLAIAISVMCGVILLICFLVALLDVLTRRSIRNKARNIVVASASFDKTGKLLVKNDGTIPMQVISTDADLQRVLRELDPRQPTFQWLYQLSFNWSVVTPFVPRILRSVIDRSRGKVQRASPMERGMPSNSWETLLFRSRFIEASVLLAQQLDLSVESLGHMFDRVLTTGTQAPVADDPNKEKSAEEGKGGLKGDDESSIHGVTLRLRNSEGVMIFLVREIGSGHPSAWDNPNADKNQLRSVDNVDHYSSRGYRMAETRFFSKAMADHFGVSKQEMDVFLSACKTYAKRGTRPVVQSQGAYLGLFGVRPTGERENLDVLVYNFARHQIPAYRLPDVQYPMSPAMIAWIRQLANCTMGELLERCNQAVAIAESADDGQSLNSQVDEQLYEFQAALAVSIEALVTALRCWPTLLQIATLSPEILEIPASENDAEEPAQMVVIEVILPAPDARLTPVQSRASGVQAPNLSGRHETDKPPAPFVYTPFSLFAKSQAMLLRARAYHEFSRATGADLNRVYPLVPTDVAAEIEAYDNEKSSGPTVNPFSKFNRMSKHNKGLLVDVDAARGVDQVGELPSSPIGSDTTESGQHEKSFGSFSSVAPLNQRIRPSTGGSDNSVAPMEGSGVRKGLTSLMSKATGGYGAEEKLDDASILEPPAVKPPVFEGVRTKTDGWFMRSMRDLERTDRMGMLDGVQWGERH